MNQKLCSISLFVIFSLILLNSTSAILGYLRPPKMIIRLNTSETVERSFVIQNVNNISIVVNASISGNISEVITIKNPSFELIPNETKTMDFTTKTDKSGVYSGQIVVTYNNEPIQIASDITIFATGKPSNTPETPDMTPTIIIALIIIVVIVIFFKSKRSRKI